MQIFCHSESKKEIVKNTRSSLSEHQSTVIEKTLFLAQNRSLLKISSHRDRTKSLLKNANLKADRWTTLTKQDYNYQYYTHFFVFLSFKKTRTTDKLTYHL